MKEYTKSNLSKEIDDIICEYSDHLDVLDLIIGSFGMCTMSVISNTPKEDREKLGEYLKILIDNKIKYLNKIKV